ncbi:MAG: DUF1735 domain-containing protein [Chitinophagaceae bacterium]|nr:DUF1735 domain-containing protein [Chitinophagaceae bacterium]
MKNISSYFLLFALGVSFASCLKDKAYEDGLYGAVRNTEGGKYVSIVTAGLQNFSKSSILISTSSADVKTVEVIVSLDLGEKSSAPQTVKIGIDNSKIASYNTANSKNFEPVTSDMIKLKATELTIPAGESYAKTTIEVYQNKFDPSKSYLIPITILEAPGATMSANLNTRYFNIIGNPYAGAYKHDFTRFNNQTGTGTPHSLSYNGKDRTALPISEKVFSVPSGYYIEPNYNVTANSNGTFTVVLNAADVKTMKDNGVELVEGPRIIKADVATKEFIFQYVVQAGANYRYIIDRYYKP